MWSQEWSRERAEGHDDRRTTEDADVPLTCGNAPLHESSCTPTDACCRSSNPTATASRPLTPSRDPPPGAQGGVVASRVAPSSDRPRTA